MDADRHRPNLQVIEGEAEDDDYDELEPDPTALDDPELIALEQEAEVSEIALDLDGFRFHLNRIGKIALLTAGQEVDLAQKMERGIQASAMLESYKTNLDGYAQEVLEKRKKAQTEPFIMSELDGYAQAKLVPVVARGEKAKQSMIEANLRLVVSIAKRYRGHGLSMEDLYQEGTGGLNRAVEKFDWRKGFKFSTYATWWIRQSVQRAVANQSRNIRVPVHIAEREMKINRARVRLLVKLERDPTDEELAQEASLPLKHVKEVLNAAKTVASLDRPIGDDEDGSYGDLFANQQTDTDEAAGINLRNADLWKAISNLSNNQQIVLILRYGLGGDKPQTLEAVGEVIGVTRERVRQIEKDALKRMAVAPEADSLREYA
ncbi:MAG TPA: sigma-70 family RNA polymerase sigma factor [Candidatus Saccharimonadales bacterium]|nr:sigma-70 family RNA polymerase sigma factor [Candidatus Saccharimonadales bacterium]